MRSHFKRKSDHHQFFGTNAIIIYMHVYQSPLISQMYQCFNLHTSWTRNRNRNRTHHPVGLSFMLFVSIQSWVWHSQSISFQIHYYYYHCYDDDENDYGFSFHAQCHITCMTQSKTCSICICVVEYEYHGHEGVQQMVPHHMNHSYWRPNQSESNARTVCVRSAYVAMSWYFCTEISYNKCSVGRNSVIEILILKCKLI